MFDLKEKKIYDGTVADADATIITTEDIFVKVFNRTLTVEDAINQVSLEAIAIHSSNINTVSIQGMQVTGDEEFLKKLFAPNG